jgi:hypothetical protein
MRITIHFPHKPDVTITKCNYGRMVDNSELGRPKEYLLIETSDDSVWDMLLDAFERVFISGEESIKDEILVLYNDSTCSIKETEEKYYKVTGMSAIEVSEKEFND